MLGSPLQGAGLAVVQCLSECEWPPLLDRNCLYVRLSFLLPSSFLNTSLLELPDSSSTHGPECDPGQRQQ